MLKNLSSLLQSQIIWGHLFEKKKRIFTLLSLNRRNLKKKMKSDFAVGLSRKRLVNYCEYRLEKRRGKPMTGGAEEHGGNNQGFYYISQTPQAFTSNFFI